MSPPPASTLKRVHAVVRWIPFVFIVSLVTFAAGVLINLHVGYTLVRKQWYVSSVVNILLVCTLAGMTLWSFAVAVFKSPGYPKGIAANGLKDWDQRPRSDTRWDRSQGLEEEQVGLTEDTAHLSDEDAADADGEETTVLLDEPAQRRTLEHRTSASTVDRFSDRADPNADVFNGHASSILPGQPKMPARTGRSQLNDLIAIVQHAKEQRNDGRVYLSRLQVKSNGARRWCRQCQCEKPDRAHHCSTCGYCVLRMDHHCPWLASRCIGLRNHKAFFLFLAYTAALCCFAAQDCLRALIQWVDEEPKGYETAPITWAVILFLGFIFGMALVPFACYHAYLICRNRTTLESMEGAGRVRISFSRQSSSATSPPRPSVSDRLRKLTRANPSTDEARSSRQAGQTKDSRGRDDAWKADEELTREERRVLRKANKLNIYNVGVKRNWQFVMGPRWPLWFIPVGDPDSDGQLYEINENTLHQLEKITSQIRTDDNDNEHAHDHSNGPSHATPPPSHLPPPRTSSGQGIGAQHRVNGAFSTSPISSIRGKIRKPSISQAQHPSAASDVSSGGHAGSPHASPAHGRHRSAHGMAQWGARPKKDFVMYGLGDEDEDSGGVLGTGTQAPEGVDSSNHHRPHHQQAQMDADVWSS